MWGYVGGYYSFQLAWHTKAISGGVSWDDAVRPLRDVSPLALALVIFYVPSTCTWAKPIIHYNGKLVVWVAGFQGSVYERHCYERGARFESQTTGPQTTHSLVELRNTSPHDPSKKQDSTWLLVMSCVTPEDRWILGSFGRSPYVTRRISLVKRTIYSEHPKWNPTSTFLSRSRGFPNNNTEWIRKGHEGRWPEQMPNPQKRQHEAARSPKNSGT